VTCSTCLAPIPDQARFCPECGVPVSNAAEAATVYTPPHTPRGTPSRTPSGTTDTVLPRRSGSGSHARVGGRFPAGTLLAGRYRINGLLGKGGMGEVYRADDLTLGQTVALKFLPEALVADPEWLDRFRNEVRAAREVSHPNVCRVYDIADSDGQTFISMEFIQGEDLASLLRRIGRLSADKASEMARGLCAGLAAAHDKGVLHRDLKPSNVLIDEQGRVRLADFGLAGGDVTTSSVVGTPAYMAPELFSGSDATVQSDLYALGLVLFELFSGRPAFSGASITAIVREHRESPPPTLTEIVPDLDPLVNRIIKRCLEKDPANRPSSALLVAAALPGGDPLAAALAAGETPSPQIVAASGGVGAIAPMTAGVTLVAVMVGLALVIALSRWTQAVSYLPQSRPPEVLADAAETMLERLGVRTPARDSAWGFTPTDYIDYLTQSVTTADRWDSLRPGQPPGVAFWYRRSPSDLTSDSFFLAGRVTMNQPPPVAPGMATVMLDLKGRLQSMLANVDRRMPMGTGEAPDWTPLLREAGLDRSKLTPATPVWTPPTYTEARAAWDGVYPDRPDIKIHVEAATAGGRPVYFQIFEPWSQRTLTPATPRGRPSLTAIAGLTAPVLVVIGALLLARRNLRLERGDRAGAIRLATAICLMQVFAGLITAHHTFEPISTIALVIVLVARGTAFSALAYLVYMALEPDVRRRSPKTLVAWSRVLAGRLADPLVGRDLLAGLAAGVAMQLLIQLASVSPAWLNRAPLISMPPAGFDGSVLATVAQLLVQAGFAVLIASSVLLGWLLIFVIVRRRGVTTALFTAVLVALASVNVGLGIQLVFAVLSVGALILTLARFGLFALIVAMAVRGVLDQIPLVLSPSAWMAPAAYTALGAIVLVAGYGFRTALAGRSLVPEKLLD
jgi:hypothetical protein